MMKLSPAVVAVIGTLVFAVVARAQDDESTLPSVHLKRAFGQLEFHRPVQVTHAGDNRLFVVEQNGRIQVFENSSDHGTPDVFLDIRSKVRRKDNEEGLLSLAFHPRYPANGFFYVYYSASGPRRGILSRFKVSADDPNRAEPDSERVILEVDQPYGNHNGATVLFGPDGYLYMSLGDGGSAFDPQDNGQNLSTLLGSILRIDVDREQDDHAYAIPSDNPFVDRPDARGEIWAYGLRNVWRMSFDRETGDLWAGDVGQNTWEEIDLITRGGNYGWRIREAAHPFKDGTPPDPMIDPVIEYPQRRGKGRSMELVGMSITGGYVYRGRSQPPLAGLYLYADYVTGRIWAMRYENDGVAAHRRVFDGPPRVYISSFGEDADGELYICSFDGPDGRGGGTGRLYRVVVK
jgi:glucose/arabinose dehydrogenase